MLKKVFKGKKAVFFDLDGTVTNSLIFWECAFTRVLHNLGTPNISPKLDGTSVIDIWENILRENEIATNKKPEELTKETYGVLAGLLEQMDLTDGITDFLLKLRQMGIKLALLSNTDREIVDKELAHFGLDKAFDLVIGGNEVKNRKPSSEIYQAAMKKLKVNPSQCLAFEDSPVGAAAAVRAGAAVFVLWDGKIPQDFYPRKVQMFLSSFSGLSDVLDKTYTDLLKEYADEFGKSSYRPTFQEM